MIDIVLMSNLAAWANIPPEPPGGVRSLSLPEKLAHLERWQPILDVRQKLVPAFRPRDGETDVFIHAFTGDRLAYPSCIAEQLLTPEEIDLLDEDDPILDLLAEGWNAAINVVRLQVTA